MEVNNKYCICRKLNGWSLSKQTLCECVGITCACKLPLIILMASLSNYT